MRRTWTRWLKASVKCFAYDNVLRKNGHFIRLEGLESARNAKTLRCQNGRVTITDGPYAETKEQLGGLLLLEANDLNHAIQLMSQHPGISVALSRSVLSTRGLQLTPTKSGSREGIARVMSSGFHDLLATRREAQNANVPKQDGFLT